MNKTLKTIISIASILCLIVLLYIMFNQELSVSKYDVTNSKIPKEFDNFKIVQLSDLHYATFGPGQKDLIDKVKACKPDIIVLTGDMIDRLNTDFNNTSDLFWGIKNIAPIYCISGNHELSTYSLEVQMSKIYNKYNITHLKDNYIDIKKGNSSIKLYGLDYFGAPTTDQYKQLLRKRLTQANPNEFSILLNHASNAFDEISTYNYNLVLSGHAHGGIIRLPFIGGLIGNNKTFFPEYDAGIYKNNNSVMVVSRGLGNSNKVPRILNRPDIVVITLHSK